VLLVLGQVTCLERRVGRHELVLRLVEELADGAGDRVVRGSV
jgi:hypothetical protein